MENSEQVFASVQPAGLPDHQGGHTRAPRREMTAREPLTSPKFEDARQQAASHTTTRKHAFTGLTTAAVIDGTRTAVQSLHRPPTLGERPLLELRRSDLKAALNEKRQFKAASQGPPPALVVAAERCSRLRHFGKISRRSRPSGALGA